MSTHANNSFAAFLKTRPEAANAYVNGDSAPVVRFSSGSPHATFFPPPGGHLQGCQQINEANEKGAANFQRGGTSHLEILQSGESGDVGYWIGLQRAEVRRTGKPEPVSMTLRVTEIFRRENGEWRLIHRHADMLAEPKGQPS